MTRTTTTTTARPRRRDGPVTARCVFCIGDGDVAGVGGGGAARVRAATRRGHDSERLLKLSGLELGRANQEPLRGTNRDPRVELANKRLTSTTEL
mmetsp:Transcript_17968/g.55283  ORF Transcript_17968/g.55283 Transcript_17968/m.55283 type:complete len:95 (-) Transcript_17968:2810-3094(-)